MKPPTINVDDMFKLSEEQLRKNIIAEYDLEDTENNNKKIDLCLKYIKQASEKKNGNIFSYSHVTWEVFHKTAECFYKDTFSSVVLDGKPIINFSELLITFKNDQCIPNEIFPISCNIKIKRSTQSNWRDIVIDQESIDNLVYSALVKLNDSLVFTGKCMFGLPDGTHHPLDCIKISADADTFEFPSEEEAEKCLLFICVLHTLRDSNGNCKLQLQNTLKTKDHESYLLLSTQKALLDKIYILYETEKLLAIFSMFYGLKVDKNPIYHRCTQKLRSSAKFIDLFKQVVDEARVDISLFRKIFQNLDKNDLVIDDAYNLNVVAHLNALGCGSKCKCFTLKNNFGLAQQLVTSLCLLTGNANALFIQDSAGRCCMEEQNFIAAISFCVCRKILATEREDEIILIQDEIFSKCLELDEEKRKQYSTLSRFERFKRMHNCIVDKHKKIFNGDLVLSRSGKYFYKYWVDDVRGIFQDLLRGRKLSESCYGRLMSRLFWVSDKPGYERKMYPDLVIPKNAEIISC